MIVVVAFVLAVLSAGNVILYVTAGHALSLMAAVVCGLGSTAAAIVSAADRP